MSDTNRRVVLFIALCTVIGALAGHVLIGLLIGLLFVTAAEVTRAT